MQKPNRKENKEKHIVTIASRPLDDASRDCGKCQVSCQSACKTSCTVGNQLCAKE